MWDSIVQMFESGQGAWVVLTFIMIGITARFGHIKIKTDKILIGRESGEKERLLMKKQIDYAHTACMAFEKRIPRFENYNTYLGKYIAELTYDEIVSWITVNHIQDNDDYIRIKQDIIWDIITTQTISDNMQTEKFRKQVYSNVEQIIRRLVQIRTNDRKGENDER